MPVAGTGNPEEAIKNMFADHPRFGSQPARYEAIRAAARALAFVINDACPESVEKSLAFTHIQNAAMWATAAIAINEREEIHA